MLAHTTLAFAMLFVQPPVKQPVSTVAPVAKPASVQAINEHLTKSPRQKTSQIRAPQAAKFAKTQASKGSTAGKSNTNKLEAATTASNRPERAVNTPPPARLPQSESQKQGKRKN